VAAVEDAGRRLRKKFVRESQRRRRMPRRLERFGRPVLGELAEEQE
jgi:hypothetical protein